MTSIERSVDDLPPFDALWTESVDGAIRSRIVPTTLAQLTDGELVVRTRFAGINYKDCLAILGRAKIAESLPRVCGIELVGTVMSSSDGRFAAGDDVVVHGYRTGSAFDGGFAAFARVPAAHAMRLPAGLDPHEVATIGVPGFTVALALDAFERNGIAPDTGPIAVSGASGAVGLLALSILQRAGYRVAAITRRPDDADALLALGADEVVDARALPAKPRALEPARFAAALDNVGGTVLSWLLASLRPGGQLAAVGNAASNAFDGNVLPFLMRGVTLHGIVANATPAVRERLWARLAGDWKPDFARLAGGTHRIRLDALPAHAQRQLDGATRGRTLVAFDA